MCIRDSTYGMPVNITRCSNNYGPYQFPEKLIPLMINNVKHHKQLPVYGDGMQIRDWLYVEDHCKAIDMVATGGKVGEVDVYKRQVCDPVKVTVPACRKTY